MTSNPARTPALSELMKFIEIAEKRIYPQPDKPNSDWAQLQRAKAELEAITRTPTGDPSGAEEIARDIVSQVAVDEYQGHRLRDLIAAALRASRATTEARLGDLEGLLRRSKAVLQDYVVDAEEWTVLVDLVNDIEAALPDPPPIPTPPARGGRDG
jgi:hypothetical protein